MLGAIQVVVAHLLFADVVLKTKALLFLELAAEVGLLGRTAGFAVHPGRMRAGCEKLFAFGGQRNSEPA